MVHLALRLLKIRRFQWPEMVAFFGAFLNNITSCDYECHIFLPHHPPEVNECIIQGALASNYFSIVGLTCWPIDEVRIYIAAYHWVFMLKAFAR